MNTFTKTPPRQAGENNRQKIIDFLRENQVTISPVSLREISTALDLALSTVNHHIKTLERKGIITHPKGKSLYFALADQADDIPTAIKTTMQDLEEKSAESGKPESAILSSSGWKPTTNGKARFKIDSIMITVSTIKKGKGK